MKRFLKNLSGRGVFGLERRHGSSRFRPTVEGLEERRVPATLTIDGTGLLTYTAGAGVANQLRISENTLGGRQFYVFSDVEQINPSALRDVPTLVAVSADSVRSMVINLEDGNDSLVVNATGVPIQANAGTGNDTIEVGGVRGLGGIRALVTVDGQGHDSGGADVLRINDQLTDATNGILYTITDHSVEWVEGGPVSGPTGSASGPLVAYGGVEKLVLDASPGNNMINVRGTAAGTRLTINAGTGDDVVNIGEFGPEAPPPQVTVLGAVTVNGQDGADVLNVNDQGVVSGRTYTVEADALTGSGMARVSYATVENVNVHAGQGSDEVQLASTAAGTAVRIDGAGGNDVFALGGSGSLDRIKGTLTLEGGIGADTLDYSKTAADVTVSLLTGAATAVAGGVSGFENVLGGSGVNKLTGDNNANILIGGRADDTLSGLGGRDLLIGGLGQDVLNGGADDDILIGGTTSFGVDVRPLQAILAQWVRTDQSYFQRVSSLHRTLTSATVFHDASADVFNGGDGMDWFWAAPSDSTDLSPFEQTN